MSNTVSDLAYYCAHCGHLEPVNKKQFDESGCTIGLVYCHKDDCKVGENLMLNDLFTTAWNCRTQMQMNDSLGRHTDAMICDGVSGFINEYLTKDSHFIKCNPKKWWND